MRGKMADADGDKAHAHPTASQEVFNLPELAEMIFLQLSYHDVLCCVQRVCRQWRDIILASNPIQQALFFKPITTTKINLVIEEPWWLARSRWQAEGSGKSVVPVEHQMMSRVLGVDHGKGNGSSSWSYPAASWRRQLALQPPTRAVKINPVGPCSGPTATNDLGVTLGDVHRFVGGRKVPSYDGDRETAGSWDVSGSLACVRQLMLDA